MQFAVKYMPPEGDTVAAVQNFRDLTGESVVSVIRGLACRIVRYISSSPARRWTQILPSFERLTDSCLRGAYNRDEVLKVPLSKGIRDLTGESAFVLASVSLCLALSLIHI